MLYRIGDYAINIKNIFYAYILSVEIAPELSTLIIINNRGKELVITGDYAELKGHLRNMVDVSYV